MEQGPLETTGRTVEEAVEAALQQLGIDRDDADVVVLNEGRGGILGLGSEQARVQVSVRDEEPPPLEREQRPPREEVTFVNDEDADRAREIVENLLNLMDVDVEVDIYNPSTDPNSNGSGGPVVLDVFGEDAGLLIGRRGATLHDLQSIVTTMVSRTLGHYIPLRVDVEGYQQRRLDRAEQLALRAAERVEERRRSITLDPMTPAERRIVHTTLADNSAVETQSSGEGEERRVTVSPVGGEAPPRNAAVGTVVVVGAVEGAGDPVRDRLRVNPAPDLRSRRPSRLAPRSTTNWAPWPKLRMTNRTKTARTRSRKLSVSRASADCSHATSQVDSPILLGLI